MSDPLGPSLVRLFASDGSVVGAGFLVREDRLLTCAHVVSQALGMPDLVPPPEQSVSLDFPLVAPQVRASARVVEWQPVGTRGGSASEDVALLQLDSPRPPGTEPVNLAHTDDVWGHRFRAFGFPSAHDDGVWAAGVLRAAQASGWVQIEDDKQTGYFVAPGFSGTPIWDEGVGAVVGMVVGAERRSEVRAAYMIPTGLLGPSVGPAVPAPQTRTPRIFLSYKRNADPDQVLANELTRALREQGCELFIDQLLPIGAEWPDRLKSEIRAADFFLVLLSRQAVQSEMLEGEIRAAYEFGVEQHGRPAILPVRVANREPFRYTIGVFLERLNWAVWDGPVDTPRLVAELMEAIRGGQLSVKDADEKRDMLQAAPGDGLIQPLPSPPAWMAPRGSSTCSPGRRLRSSPGCSRHPARYGSARPTAPTAAGSSAPALTARRRSGISRLADPSPCCAGTRRR